MSGALSRRDWAKQLARRQMTDTCKVLTRSGGTRDQYGYKGASYAPGAALACAFDPTSSEEVAISTTQIGVSTGTVYLELGTEVRAMDRIQITHRNGDGTPGSGEALSPPLTYDVLGTPEVQPTTLAAKLSSLVTTGGA